MAENWCRFDQSTDLEDTEMANRVINLGFSYLAGENQQFGVLGRKELSGLPTLAAMLGLRRQIILQYRSMQSQSKIQPVENLRLKFDKKCFTANLDIIENKLERVAKEYTTCLDKADDSELDHGKEQADLERQKCHRSTNQRLGELSKFLEHEGKTKLFSYANS